MCNVCTGTHSCFISVARTRARVCVCGGGGGGWLWYGNSYEQKNRTVPMSVCLSMTAAGSQMFINASCI